MRKSTITGLVLAMGFAATPVPMLGEPGPLAMLNQLQKGNWELRERGVDPQSPSTMCVDTGRKLIQLRHPGLSCSSMVIDDSANDVTVQYTCPGQGYGRTHIRRENNGLVQIDSQGIAKGLPFSFAMEARRVGGCAAS